VKSSISPSPDVLSWLLDPFEPSVRYWVLTKVLGRSERDAEVQDARQQIMDRGPAAAILSHYNHSGQWTGERSYYTYKYTSTHWQLLLLAELAADGQDRRINAACRRMIEEVASEERDAVWPCFHGNLIGYLHALGHAEDSRVRRFEAELASAATDGQWYCSNNGNRPCSWGVARALWGSSRIAANSRAQAVQDTITCGIRFLADYDLGAAECPGNSPRHKLWDRLSFPLFYQADILFTLHTLADLDCLEAVPSTTNAIQWLQEQRRKDGRWNGSNPYGGRLWTPLEGSHRPSKWITWQALYILNAHG